MSGSDVSNQDVESRAINRRMTSRDVAHSIASIQNRFIERIGDRLALSLTRSELLEELLIETLALSDAHYGCVIAFSPELLACVARNDEGSIERCSNTGLQRDETDRVMNSVRDAGKATFSNQGFNETPCLPSQHPVIESYAMLPMRQNGRVESILFIANASNRFDLLVINRLQSLINSFLELQLNSIVTRGMNTVIDDVGRISRQLVTLVGASLNGVLAIDQNGIITAFNPACERMFAVEVRRALGSEIKSLLSSSVLETVLGKATSYQHSVTPRDSEAYSLRNSIASRIDGSEFPVDLMVYHTRVQQRVFTTFIINDITDRMDSARELQDTLVQFKTLTKLAPVGIVELDIDWTCLYANDMWCRLSHLAIEDTLKTGWIDALHPEDVAETLTDMRTALDESRTYHRELRLNSPNGDNIWVSLSATGLLSAQKRLTGSLMVVMDITEKHNAEQRLKQIAHHDALTGLLNRTFFLDRLEQAIDSSGRRGDVALLFIDLDGFKAVNDTLGHDFGDELLRQVGATLRDTVRDEDTVARFGGDEFTITITHLADVNHAGLVAEKVVNRLRTPFDIMGQEVFISASVGIAVGNRENSDSASLLKQADVALYRAKSSGRSRYVFFTPELDQAQRDRMTLLSSLRRAVDRNEFELHYQPQMLIQEQTLLGFEALLRWPGHTDERAKDGSLEDDHEPKDLQSVSVEDCVDALEEAGLISDVGQWAIDEACRQYMQWRSKGLIEESATMSVNVSGRQLSMPHFDQLVARVLSRHLMPACSLVLEITESTLVQAAESNIIAKIKQLGVQISLDDFGTGYSSLSYLTQLPLDHLKIDRSFISDIASRPQAVTIVKSIIALARTLNIKVVAEGVEDPYILPLLAAEGCAAYQGFHFSKALPPSEMETLLASLDTVRLGHLVNFIDLDDDRPQLTL